MSSKSRYFTVYYPNSKRPELTAAATFKWYKLAEECYNEKAREYGDHKVRMKVTQTFSIELK